MAIMDDRELTVILKRVSDGDREALEKLAERVYPELKRIAVKRLKRERSGHTLQPTALVNEVFLRLFGSAAISWKNRAHFFAVAAKQMRFILVDHARRKHGATNISLTLETGREIDLGLVEINNEDFIALNEALSEFEEIDARAARGVELRFFGGLTLEEVAEVQGINLATVKRDWVFAKSWLYGRLVLSTETNPDGAK